MSTKMQREIVIVYTKQFPFGFRETYILDEIEALKTHFDEVYFYPYAEFQFKQQELRIKENHQFHILKFNQAKEKNGFFKKLEFLSKALMTSLGEILFSRQKAKALKRIKQNFFRLYHFAAQAKQLDTWLNQQSARITHYHYWFHDGLVISNFSKTAKNQIHFARAHSIDLYHKDWPLGGYLPFEIIKQNLVSKIYSVSQHGLKYLQSHFPKLRNKFAYQPLGIEIDFIPEIKKPLPKILTISFLGEVKNFPRMIDLMKLLKNHFTWVHIGSGNKEMETWLKEICAREKIQFDFLGHMTKQEINKFLNNNPMAYFANTSTWEGVPVSMMEAGLFGIPFIATDIPGNLEIVSENNGFIIPLTGDLNEIALKICKCFEDANLWKDKAVKAQAIITSQYNAALNHKAFFEAIKITS